VGGNRKPGILLISLVIHRTPIEAGQSLSMVCCTVHWPLAEADLGVVEFQGLWRYIKEWQDVFKHFDRDRSGSIDGQELSAALKSFGYQLSPMLLSMIEQKYGERDFGSDAPRVGGTYLPRCSFWAGSGIRPPARHHFRSLREGLRRGQDFD
jgi:hypothetical protein